MLICLVGSCTKVIYLKTLSLISNEEQSLLADVMVEGFGNDALNVGYALGLLGRESHLICNPININDERSLSYLKDIGVNFDLVEINDKSNTPITVMLEDNNGKRKFVTSKNDHLESNGKLVENSNFFYYYLDMYDEYMEQVYSIIKNLSQRKKKIFVNLSSSSIDKKINILSSNINIDVLQASYTGDDIENYLRRIYNTVNVNAVILTCGKKGAFVISNNKIDRATPKIVNELNHIIGTGAFFSAGYIDALAKGMNYVNACYWAVDFVSEHCKSIRTPFLLEK